MNMIKSCVLCQPSSHPILWQDEFCRVVLLNDTDYPGYCRVELLEHIKEMSDLASPQRVRMMKVVFAVETAIREIVLPDKINIASLGNKTPHIHWHVIPRFEDDKHFPNSHWGEVMRENNTTLLEEKTVSALSEKMKSLIQCALN
jgi:diadenosine tetraphosphate (Ap4A) HIT family hydrolase